MTNPSLAVPVLMLSLAMGAQAHSDHESAGAAMVALGRPVMTGNGEFRFLSQPDWAKFADGMPIGSTHGGVAIDRSGLV